MKQKPEAPSYNTPRADLLMATTKHEQYVIYDAAPPTPAVAPAPAK